MSALVSRANGIVCMAMSPAAGVEGVDTSSSPTSPVEHESIIDFSECQVHQTVFVVTPELSNGVDIVDCERILHKNEFGLGAADATTTLPKVAPSSKSCSLGDEPVNFIPSCICDAENADERSQDGSNASNIFRRQSIGQCTERPPSADVDDSSRDAGKDNRSTPLCRISTSSIPHLISASKVFSAEGQHLIHRQLQLRFMDNEVPSRENSFVFPVDGDDSGFGSSHLDKIVRSAASLSLESTLSSPTVSVASGRIHVLPAPYNIPLQVDESVHPQVHLTITCQEHPGNIEQNDLDTSLHPGSTRTIRSAKQTTVPILYSAINSLERYNAGSFDNKVLLAKARGMHGKQKAFPGVPRKGADSSSPENIIVEGFGCRSNISATSPSARRKCSMGSTLNEEGKKLQLDTSPASIEQSRVEQPVAITSVPSRRRVHKSKSSGNLGQDDGEMRTENMEELKAYRRSKKGNRSVVINDNASKPRKGRRRDKRVGVFRPSSDAYTPRMENRDIKYKPAEERASVEKISSTMGTIQRPNFRDALRRVAIILHQHIVKIESRFSTGTRGVDDTGLFKTSMREQFNEDNFVTPRYKCSMVRVPMARPGVVYSMRKIRVVHTTPTTDEIYEFAHQLFKKVQLSSECSIVCLIYVEKLMEVSKVPLVSETWRPIFMCGLLLASKVWQDLSSWNIEFASVYPQFSLHAINRLELLFLKFIKWDLYISSSLYAKYYFALRALLEKSGFRGRYNQMVGGPGGIAASEALKVSKRSEVVKEEVLQQLSRSM
ncbi:hypothetical protein ACHAXH_007628 [Discostella pseudostelligera]